MKKLITCFLMFILCFSVFAGCTAKSDDGMTADGKYLLTIWGGDEYTGETGAKFISFLEKFNASTVANDLGVEFRFKQQNSLPTSLGAAIQAGQSPDIVLWDRYMTPSYKNILQPIDAYLSDISASNLEKLNREAFNELKYDSVTYGLPLDLDPWGLYINQDYVDKHNEGKSVTDANYVDTANIKTWSQLKKVAKSLTKYNGDKVEVAGLNTTSMDGRFYAYALTSGVELIDLSTKQTVLKNPLDEASWRIRDTISYFKDMYEANVCSDALGGENAFVSENLAITYGSMFFPQILKGISSKEINLTFIPFPKRDMIYYRTGGGADTASTLIDPDEVVNGIVNGQYGGMLGGYGLALPKPQSIDLTPKKEARMKLAFDVINEIIFNDEINKMFYQTTEQITTRNDLVASDNFYQTNKLLSQAIKEIDSFKIRPNISGYEAFESTVVRAQLQDMSEKGTNVATIFANIMKDGNKMLSDANK